MEPPKDKKAILNMLVRPKTFGAGLFDYSCQGSNWLISEKVVSVRATHVPSLVKSDEEYFNFLSTHEILILILFLYSLDNNLLSISKLES